MQSLLPNSYKTLLMVSLEKILRTFESLPVEDIKHFWNPDKCRVDLLPYLAVCVGVTNWSRYLDETQKRNACKEALLINRKKGTVSAIKSSLKAIGMSAVVVEWFQSGKDRMTAEVILQEGEQIFNEEQYQEIYQLVNEVKRLSVNVVFSKQSAIRGTFYLNNTLLRTIRLELGA